MKPFNAADYLTSLNINVMRFGLQNVSDLLQRLGHPQKKYPSILIAGTNGKGSTAVMLASMLQQSGLKVGLYTSPHLVDVRERIVVNSVQISRRDFNAVIGEIKDHVRKPVTYFEFLTAAAFLYFSRQRVDIAVCEVGLGGRLDATNVLRPLVSVITNIGLEHTAYLGKTLAAIAGEKAGIIKKDGVCVTAATRKQVLRVLQEVCDERQARFYRLGSDFIIKRLRDGSIAYEGRRRSIGRLTPPLQGRHQLSNLALALAVIEILEEKGYPACDTAVYRGLARTRWGARLETLHTHPLFLLDGAHNPDGIAALFHTLTHDFPGRRVLLIFGALADKNHRRMLEKMLPLADRIFLPPLATSRAVSPRDLAKDLQGGERIVQVCESVAAAVRQALKCARGALMHAPLHGSVQNSLVLFA
jgi:dihydrofolate synthase/folylpolyglutamate synthase